MSADLRTALTKLADDAEAYGPGAWVAGEIRALLAAHPVEVVSDTRREDVARVRARAIRTADSLDAIGDPVIEAWDGEEFTTADLRALAALPAPPVVDEAWRP